MSAIDLNALEEYQPEKPVIKPVFETPELLGKAVHLAPGGQVPVHPHPGKTVVLIPRKGTGVAFFEDGHDEPLAADTVCPMGVDPVFGIRNTGDGPFQMLVLLAAHQ